jgi:hypothetical protein
MDAEPFLDHVGADILDDQLRSSDAKRCLRRQLERARIPPDDPTARVVDMQSWRDSLRESRVAVWPQKDGVL